MDISDTELRKRLLTFGYAPPPITDTSRVILLKKLKSLQEGTSMETAIDSVDDHKLKVENNSSDLDGPANSVRQRPVKVEFCPENVGMYSKCSARSIDFWDRIGLIGTLLVLIFATIAVFFIFKFIGDWSDRRYRSIPLTDSVFPKCSQGGNPRVTCVPDTEFKFTESNLNLVRSALHHVTLTQRCSSAALKYSDFIGLYPVFKDDFVRNILAKELGFNAEESDNLLQNSKVLFKANPRFEVKVLNEGLLYRNQRLLRSCGLTAWNTVAYSYALYFLTSFSIVWFFYKYNRWVSKLRNDIDDEKRRLIKDVVDLLKQNEKQSGRNFLPVDEVRHWLNTTVQLSDKVWQEAKVHLLKHEVDLSLEKRVVHGEEHNVFCLKN